MIDVDLKNKFRSLETVASFLDSQFLGVVVRGCPTTLQVFTIERFLMALLFDRVFLELFMMYWVFLEMTMLYWLCCVFLCRGIRKSEWWRWCARGKRQVREQQRVKCVQHQNTQNYFRAHTDEMQSIWVEPSACMSFRACEKTVWHRSVLWVGVLSTVPVRLQQEALDVLVFKQISQFGSFGKCVKTMCLPGTGSIYARSPIGGSWDDLEVSWFLCSGFVQGSVEYFRQHKSLWVAVANRAIHAIYLFELLLILSSFCGFLQWVSRGSPFVPLLLSDAGFSILQAITAMDACVFILVITTYGRTSIITRRSFASCFSKTRNSSSSRRIGL